MKAVVIEHCQAGSVTSRQDGSVKISFVTPELRPSEGGALLQLHGKNCRLSIVPEDVEPEETIMVDTALGTKTPSQRLRAVLFVWWSQQGKRGSFEMFYSEKISLFIDSVKTNLEA